MTSTYGSQVVLGQTGPVRVEPVENQMVEQMALGQGDIETNNTQDGISVDGDQPTEEEYVAWLWTQR